MLTVVHIAPNREAADRIKARLEEEGLLVMVRPVSRLDSGKYSHYELMVPHAEAEEALAILNALHT